MIERILRRILRLNSASNEWRGNYATWQAAKNESAGYDSEHILEKVARAIIEVRKGDAAFERDSVAFQEFTFSPHLRDALLSAKKSESLVVVDFGGSLGSLYFQYKRFFHDTKLRWIVVEQPHFVEYGLKNLTDNELNFSANLEDACSAQPPDLLILSSVLCYLEDPYVWIERFINTQSRFILLDRTAFIEGVSERITVQNVPEEIYPASYPAWFLNEEKCVGAFLSQYNLISELPDSIDGEDCIDGLRAYRKGFLFRRKE